MFLNTKDQRSDWSQGFPNAIKRSVNRAGLAAGSLQRTDTAAKEPVTVVAGALGAGLQPQQGQWAEEGTFLEAQQV